MPTASPLAAFRKYSGRLIANQDLTTWPMVPLETCARLCQLQLLCKSFDFKASSSNPNVGDCSLAADNITTSLTHTFIYSDQGIDHYDSNNNTVGIAATVFSSFPRSYIADASLVAVKEDVSLYNKCGFLAFNACV